MTISIKSPTSTTGSIQKNGSDVLTFDSSDNVTVVNNLSVSGTVSSTGDINFDSGTLYVDATNNRVGIGTSSPATNLDISGTGQKEIRLTSNTSGNARLGFNVAGSVYAYWEADRASGAMIYNNGSERMRITSSGNVGIGASSPGSPLTVSGTSSLGVDQTDYIDVRGGGGTGRVEAVGASANVNLALSAKGAGAVYFWGNGYGNNALMIIDQYANLTLGYTPQATVNFNGMTAGAYVDVKHPSSAGSGYGYIRFFHNGSIIGQIVQNGTTAVSYNTSSDYRLKENVAPMSGSIDRLKQLKPSTWSWVQDGSHGEGFIAHEAQEVVPEAITGTKDAMRIEEYEVTPAVEATYDGEGNELTPAVEAVMGTREVPDYQGIDQSKLVPLLTAALQEAITKIEALEARVEALEQP